MLKVSSVLIGVRDLNKAKLFYENVFGMVFDEFRPPFSSARLGDLEFNLEEDADYRDKDWARQHIGGRKCVGFEVDDLESFLTKAALNGAVILKKPELTPWGWLESIISDRDGNEFLIEQKAKSVT